jgi:DNA-binding transcriptional MocR family regulator
MGYRRYRAAKTLDIMAPAKPVLLELAQIAGDFHGTAWPSQQSLADATGYNIRTIRRALKELVSKGHVKESGWHFYKRQENRTRRYVVLPTFDTETGELEPDSQSSSTDKSNRTGMRLEPDTESLEPDSQSDKGLSKVVSSSKAATALVSETDGKLIREVWDYHQDVFDKNETFTPRRKEQGIRVLLRLQKNGRDPVESMKDVIDLAKKKTTEGKAYFSEWHAIFSDEETFGSLLYELNE